MDPKKYIGRTLTALGLVVAATGCAPVDEDGFHEDTSVDLDQQRQDVMASVNGLRTVNGLTTNNGLRTVNGLSTTNGLRTVNGITTVNGLRTVNGLTTTNGLRTVNGLTTTNGLRTVNGLVTVDGVTYTRAHARKLGLTAAENTDVTVSCDAGETITGIAFASYGTAGGTSPDFTLGTCHAANSVDVVSSLCVGQSSCTIPATNATFGDPCSGTVKTLKVAPICSSPGVVVNEAAELPVDCGASGVPGKDCWGYSEGILNPITGMMASDQGITTAKYMIRCALPAGQSVNVVDYTGSVIHLSGELGLAPTWKDGQCDTVCQENISACMMALTNASGEHIPVELSSTKNALGGGKTYPYQEGAFFGNLFAEPPQAFFCKGTSQQNIATMWYSWADDMFTARMCTGYASGQCPYKGVGDCTAMPWSPQACTKASDGTYTSCKGTVTETKEVCKQVKVNPSCWWNCATTTVCGPETSSYEKTFQYPITTYLKSK